MLSLTRRSTDARAVKPMHNWRVLAALSVASVAVGACAGGNDGLGPSDPANAGSIEAVGDTVFQRRAGETVRVVVRVLSTQGHPLANETVAFEVTSGDGTVPSASIPTDDLGVAHTNWAVGTRTGLGTLTATIGSLPSVRFDAEVVPGPSASLSLSAVPSQARSGSAFATPVVVAFRDAHGNMVEDETREVSVSIEGRGGSLDGRSTVAADDGVATFRELVPHGPLGSYRLVLASSGLPTVRTDEFPLDAPVRSMGDRTDDLDGPQIHVVYALPDDGQDRALDTSNRIPSSVMLFQRWMAGATGVAFRLDTYRGALDVTLLRIDRTEGDIRSEGPYMRDAIEQALAAEGRLESEKIYLVYYDGESVYACGGASWPPAVPGRLAAMYLRAAPCRDAELPTSPDDPVGYWEFAMVHDLVHTLGIVSTNAPNHTALFPGHVPEPRDLMYGGTAPWETGSLEVDIGGDDYFGMAVSQGLPTLDGTAYIIPAEAAPMVAGWINRQSDPHLGPALALDLGQMPPHPPLMTR